MQINIEKHHFYTLAGLLLFLILVLIFIPFNSRDMITGADVITGAPTAEQNTLRGYHVSLNPIDQTLPAHTIDEIQGLEEKVGNLNEDTFMLINDRINELEDRLITLGETSEGGSKLTKLDDNGWPIGSYCILRAVKINSDRNPEAKPCPHNFQPTYSSYFYGGGKTGVIWMTKTNSQGVYELSDSDKNKVGVYADDDNSAAGYQDGSLVIQFCCRSDD